MNKGELVDKVAERASVTKKQADAVITAIIDTIMESVSAGEKVTLVGFGSFEPRKRKEREGRNPKTGDKMIIPENDGSCLFRWQAVLKEKSGSEGRTRRRRGRVNPPWG
ncbi:MAG: HU family DNA-binding protein [Chloroflexaceae bacterium]|nr:HU family DNA-binding protein [Chloroflexaceae bacterium]